MPVPCKNPRYRYKGKVRLAFCGKKVVEAKSKKHIVLEMKYGRKLYKTSRGAYYYLTKGRKAYV